RSWLIPSSLVVGLLWHGRSLRYGKGYRPGVAELERHGRIHTGPQNAGGDDDDPQLASDQRTSGRRGFGIGDDVLARRNSHSSRHLHPIGDGARHGHELV